MKTGDRHFGAIGCRLLIPALEQMVPTLPPGWPNHNQQIYPEHFSQSHHAQEEQ